MTILKLVSDLRPTLDSDPNSTLDSLADYAAKMYKANPDTDFLLVGSQYLAEACSDLETTTYFIGQLVERIGSEVTIPIMRAGFYRSFPQFVATNGGSSSRVFDFLEPDKLGVIVKIESPQSLP
jgi:hypothetical protein